MVYLKFEIEHSNLSVSVSFKMEPMLTLLIHARRCILAGRQRACAALGRRSPATILQLHTVPRGDPTS